MFKMVKNRQKWSKMDKLEMHILPQTPTVHSLASSKYPTSHPSPTIDWEGNKILGEPIQYSAYRNKSIRFRNNQSCVLSVI